MMFSGSIFVGCLLLGTGIGMLFGHAGPGAVIGLGLGFILGSIGEGMRRVTKKAMD